jgi:hypothetical protein
MDGHTETSAPIEEKDSFNWRMFILWPFVILLLYVLSFGPVMMLAEKKRIPTNKVTEFFEMFYDPCIWAYLETPLHKPLGMYLHLWAPMEFDKNGDAIWGI